MINPNIEEFYVKPNPMKMRLDDVPFGAIFKYGPYVYVRGRVKYIKQGKAYVVYTIPLQSSGLPHELLVSAELPVDLIYSCKDVEESQPRLF